MDGARYVMVKLSPDRRRLEVEGNAALVDGASDLMQSFYRILSASVELGSGAAHGADRLDALRRAVRGVEDLCDDLIEPSPDAD